jgi:predicted nucleic acid-binding protein
VTRYLLDTNIISNIVKPEPSASLLDWMADQRDDDLFIASLTVAEIRRGILEAPAGRRREALESWFTPGRPTGAFRRTDSRVRRQRGFGLGSVNG